MSRNSDTWESLLLWRTHVGKDGKVTRTLQNCLANVLQILLCSPEWAGVLAFNEARQEFEMLQPAPFVPEAEVEGWTARPWTGVDDTLAAVWLQRRWQINVNEKIVASAVSAAAARRRYNPLQVWLASRVWDGVPRLERWLSIYAGAEETPYTRAAGAAWLRGAVARALQPGVKFDAALILEGEQGAGKSSIFAILAGDYFLDEVQDLTSKDTKISIGRAWIVELAELSALNRHEVELTKQFLSKRFDNYRPPFERRALDVPRRCVFGGSTNRSEYLRDETGARRFWPVKVGQVNLAALRADRDQLLAEAVLSWRALGDEGLRLPVEVRAAHREAAEERRQADAWEEPIRAYLQGKSSVSLGDVLEFGLGIDKDRWGRSEQMRASTVLGVIGWGRRRVRAEGELVWRYVPPPTPPPEPPPVPNGSGGVPNGSGTTAQPKGAVVPNVPNLPTSEDGLNAEQISSSCNSLEVGNVGNVGNKSINIGVSGVPNPVPNPPADPAEVGNMAAWRPLCPHCGAALVDGRCPRGHLGASC